MTTVGTILLKDFANIANTTVDVLKKSQMLLLLPSVGQVQSQLDVLHHITIVDVLLIALRASQRLKWAANRSVATRTDQPVHINGYTIPIDYKPVLQVLIDNTVTAAIEFGLHLNLALGNCDGVVIRGRLVRLIIWALAVSVALDADRMTVPYQWPLNTTLAGPYEWRSDLRYELPLPAQGIPLIPVRDM